MLPVRGALAKGPALARLSAGRRICRKYRKAYIRKLQQQEYDRLRSMVPSLSADRQRKKRISKIKVIEATIHYIDQLHHALAERFRAGADSEAKVKDEHVATETKRLFFKSKGRVRPSGDDISSHRGGGAAPVVCEKDRRIPSYLLQSGLLSRTGD